MKTFSPTRLAYRQARTGVVCRSLLWITARDRSTGAAAAIGLWNGDDHQVFSIDSQGRTYYGAGNLIAIDDIVGDVGLTVKTLTVKLAALTPEVRQAVRNYDARFAKVEIHRAEFDTDTGYLIEEPERRFKGWIDGVSWPTAPVGGTADCTLTLVSAARALTRTLAAKFSDASQQLVNPSDRFFQYADIGAGDVWWGEKRGAG